MTLKNALSDLQLGTYSDKYMIISLIVVLVIGGISLLLFHIPIKLLLCFGNRMRWYRRSHKQLAQRCGALYRPKTANKVYNTFSSLFYLFWLVLCPLTILAMFSRLPIYASILIQVVIWFIVLLHFAVKSDYRSFQNKSLSSRISSLDIHLGGKGEDEDEFEANYEMDQRLDDQEEPDEEFDDESSYADNTLQRRSKFDITFSDDLQVCNLFKIYSSLYINKYNHS
jgi:hypothetical protein